MPGCDLNLTIPHDREAVGEANVACLGIAYALIDVVSDRKEYQNPNQKEKNGPHAAVISTSHLMHSICCPICGQPSTTLIVPGISRHPKGMFHQEHTGL